MDNDDIPQRKNIIPSAETSALPSGIPAKNSSTPNMATTAGTPNGFGARFARRYEVPPVDIYKPIMSLKASCANHKRR
jgi:hypothetical protein